MARRQPAVSSVKVVLLGRNVVQQNITQNHADGYGVCGVDSWYVADGRCPSLPLVGKTYAAKVPDPEISPSMTTPRLVCHCMLCVQDCQARTSRFKRHDSD
mmetsp:Transcript_43145/g.71737  ORF Transcript_43145/g.71737 Transcript_43145/m.71737 type:complete len:101 (-) Transcript_43145:95-397(-)